MIKLPSIKDVLSGSINTNTGISTSGNNGNMDIFNVIHSVPSSGLEYNNALEDAMGRGGIDLKGIPHTYTPNALDSYVGLDDKYNPITININPYDTVVSSHEMGHAGDMLNTKSKKLYTILDKLPIIHNLSTLIREARANRISWKALKEAYKDNPKLLEEFGKLRSGTLSRAYGTYLSSCGIPLVTSLAGGVLGAKLLSKHFAKESDNDKDLDNFTEEGKKKLKKKRKGISKALGLITGGGLGLYAGSKIGNILAIPALVAQSIDLSRYMKSPERRKALFNLDEGILDDFRSRKK